MRAVEKAGLETASWFVREPAKPRAGVRPAYRAARLDDNRITSARAVIASSLFLVLLASTLVIGGHVAIDPFLHRSAAHNGRETGDVVLAMPDGKFCRHMSFDNATAEVVESAVEPCRGDIGRDKGRSPRGFSWGEP